MCACVYVCVRQCVTSRKLLSADLHYALFPLTPRERKTGQFCKTEERQKKSGGGGAAEPPVATIKVQRCQTKGSVITLLLAYARYHVSDGKILSNFDSSCNGACL